jgi:hypothetical protein
VDGTITADTILKAAVAGSIVCIAFAAYAIFKKNRNKERIEMCTIVFKVFIILLGALDFITDTIFTAELFQKGHLWYAYVSLSLLIGSVLVGVVVVLLLLRSAGAAIAWHVVFDSLPFYVSILLISATNLETLWLLPWDIKGGGVQMQRDLKLYQGFPLKLFVKGTIAMRFVEDVPQLCLQSAYALEHGAAAATVASLSSSLFDLLFKLMTSAIMLNFGHLAIRRLTATEAGGVAVVGTEQEAQVQTISDNPMVDYENSSKEKGGASPGQRAVGKEVGGAGEAAPVELAAPKQTKATV